MADILGEITAAIRGQIQRQARQFVSQRAAVALGPQVANPANPYAASIVAGQDDAFATGYDAGTGKTTLPFIWNLSAWGDDSTWSGS